MSACESDVHHLSKVRHLWVHFFSQIYMLFLHFLFSETVELAFIILIVFYAFSYITFQILFQGCFPIKLKERLI